MPFRPNRQPLRVSILSLPESGTMAAFGLHEVLGDTGRNDSALSRPIHPALIASRTAPFRASTGLRVTPDAGLTGDERVDLLGREGQLAEGDHPGHPPTG